MACEAKPSAVPKGRRLGTKRQFVDIEAQGRAAPQPRSRSTLDKVERRRKLELRELHADQRHAAQLAWAHNTNGRPGGVTLCGWTIIAGRQEVEVIRETAPDKAPRGYLKGLQKCGLGWVCPICTRAKAEAGRRRINALLSRGRAEGWEMVMVTLTARHDRNTDLDAFWAAMSQASNELRRTHAWTRGVNPVLLGSIRAVEATHGAENGWHPHFHVILVFPAGAVSDQAAAIAQAETLRGPWMERLAAVGLTGNEHAFHVQGAAAAGHYLSKWGMGEELALGHAKQGRKGQRTPWQLLRDSRQGDCEAGELWWEFTRVIAGTHQLRMTPGLKNLVAEEVDRLEAEAPVVEKLHQVRIDGIEPGEWMDTGRRRRVLIREGAEARTRREAERAVWLARHGDKVDRDLTDLVVIDDEDVPADRRPVHDEPEVRLAAIKRAKAEERSRKRQEFGRLLHEIEALTDPGL